jgi:uncharacterized protein YggE
MQRIDRISTIMRASGILAVGLAALIAAIVLVAAAVMLRDGRATAEPATLTTTATGEVQVPASSATTRVALRACSDGPGGAMQQLNARFASMSKEWRDLGVPAKDIARGELQAVRESRTRWCSTLDAVATVDDLDLVDEVLTGVGRHPRGIQYLEGPRYDYDTAKLESKAFDEATRIASRKSDDAARRAGTSIVGVRSIQEGAASVTRPEDQGRGGGGIYLADREALTAATMDASKATAISQSAGRAHATVRVSVVFEIED